MISLIVPSHNNLRHLKNCYTSIRKHAKDAEIVLLDDASTDGTYDWMQEVYKADDKVVILRSEERKGHTILYDLGIEYASNDVVGILHADMIIGPNYVENLIKHLKPGSVICATRVEPPLHPPGKEKIIKDFGLDFDSLDVQGFEAFCTQAQQEYCDQTTQGMFAPWILHKKDFQAIGGHDSLFAPFPYEDSDIFQRWILAGYKLIQSRDAFVYHLTCRGHRWSEQVGKDDDYYKVVSHRAARNYLRKWGSWIQNDEYQYPTIIPKYDIGFWVENCHQQVLEFLEPWCSTIYTDQPWADYIEREQPNTAFDLPKRVMSCVNRPHNDIVVYFDAAKLTQQSVQIIQQLSQIIKQSGEVGRFELDVFQIEIKALTEYQNNLIVCNTSSSFQATKSQTH